MLDQYSIGIGPFSKPILRLIFFNIGSSGHLTALYQNQLHRVQKSNYYHSCAHWSMHRITSQPPSLELTNVTSSVRSPSLTCATSTQRHPARSPSTMSNVRGGNYQVTFYTNSTEWTFNIPPTQHIVQSPLED